MTRRSCAEVLDSLLTREGCSVSLAASGEDAIELAKTDSFEVAVVDVMMPGIDGLETLDQLKRIDEDLPVITITAFGTAANTRAAFKRGAFDFIEKPFKNDDVLVVVRNAIAQRRLVTENQTLRQSLRAQTHRFNDLMGRSPRMRRVFDLVSQAAPSRTTILIQGESGTGKELAARAVHANSSRSDRPFITVNSGSLPPDLLESNLFGHVKGAFTGAVAPKKGLFELADKGSIFFDEIGSVPLETQAKLLRVIQEREFMRLGGVETLKVDVRIIVATNVDLQRMVEENRFREDLYYRLHVITIELPPLRERREDIPLLAQHLLEKYGKENAKSGLEISPDAPPVARGVSLAGQRPGAGERHRARRRVDLVEHDRGRSHSRFGLDVPDPSGCQTSKCRPTVSRFRKVIEDMESMLDHEIAQRRRWCAEAGRKVTPDQADHPSTR